jgi:tetratricopeptide (TPR) repeat protein
MLNCQAHFQRIIFLFLLSVILNSYSLAQQELFSEDLDEDEINLEIEKLDSLIRLNPDLTDENTLSWLIDLGNLYRKRGSYILAIESYENALELSLFLSKTREEAVIKNSLGGLYFEINNKEKALYYCEAALEIVNINFYNNFEDRCLLLANLGNMYIVDGNLDLAYDYLKQAEKLNAIVKNDYYASLIYSGIGTVYLERKQLSKAEQYLNLGLELSIKSENIPSKIANMANLSKLYLYKGLPYKALPLALEGYESSLRIKEPYLQRETLSVLIEVYEDLREFREALRLSKVYQQLQNDIFSEDLKTAIVKSELSLKNIENEKSLLELTIQNERQLNDLNRNRFFMILFIIIFAAALFTIILYFQKVRLKNSIAIQKLENKMIGLQLKPHFIFNVLGSIQGYMGSNDTRKASIYLSKFARLIRNVLEQSRTDFISLKSEIKHLNFYLELQQLRYDHRFSFEISFDEEQISEDMMIPPLIIQPIVENAVEHGIFSIQRGGEIKLCFQLLAPNQLEVIIQDNGGGVKKKKLNNDIYPDLQKKSVSLAVIKEQLKLFSKKYKQNYFIEINSIENKGTKVRLLIPCKTDNYET